MVLKIPISFKENEIELYNWIKCKRNYSCYLKDLVAADMKKEPAIKKDDIKRSSESFNLDF